MARHNGVLLPVGIALPQLFCVDARIHDKKAGIFCTYLPQLFGSAL